VLVTPMFPLEVAMLPGEELPLRIFEPRYTALVSDCLAADDPALGYPLVLALFEELLTRLQSTRARLLQLYRSPREQ